MFAQNARMDQDYIASSLRSGVSALEIVVGHIEKNDLVEDQELGPLLKDVEFKIRRIRKILKKGGR
jgi:hypothetical protein